MSSKLLWALLAALALTLSGCSSGGGSSDDDCEPHEDDPDEAAHTHEECETPTTSGGTPRPTTTTPPPAPNQLPIIVLTVTDDGGNETSVTLLGGNLTFSVAGSSDPDGEITNAAILVQDANNTRSAPLMEDGEFVPATFGFDHAGVVNVTVNVLDNRAGFTVNRTFAYVSDPQDLGGHSFNLAAPPEATAATDCVGPAEAQSGENNPLDPFYYKEFPFVIAAGATYVEATAVASGHAAAAVELAICAPDGTAISDAGADTVTSTNEGTLAVPAAATDAYYVAVMSRAPATDVTVSVVVHYEPRPAAAA